MTSYDSQLERQVASLFRAEASQARMPQNMWQSITPRMGDADGISLFHRLGGIMPSQLFNNPLPVKYVAPAVSIGLAILAAFLFVLLVNDDEDNGTPEPAVSPTVPVSPTAEPTQAVEGMQPDELAAVITSAMSDVNGGDRDVAELRPYLISEFAALDDTTLGIAMQFSVLSMETEPEDWTVRPTTFGFTVAQLNEFPTIGLMFQWIDGEFKLDLGPQGWFSAYLFLDQDLVNEQELGGSYERTSDPEVGIPEVLSVPSDNFLFTRLEENRLVYAVELSATRSQQPLQIDFNHVRWVTDGTGSEGAPADVLWVTGEEVNPGVFEYPAVPEGVGRRINVEIATSSPVSPGEEIRLIFGGITVGEGEEAISVTIDRSFQAGNVRVPESQVDPSPTPAATPTRTPIQIEQVQSFGEPVSGTIFEDLLARLPDNEATRSYTRLSDFQGTLDLLGIPDIQPGSDLETVIDQISETWDRSGQSSKFHAEIPYWPNHMRDYLSSLPDWHGDVAFDMWSVDQAATAGEAPHNYDVAFGEFDPSATADALAACGCDQPDLREHAGVEFYSWGENGTGELERRLDRPLYDHVGRGPRLLIRDGEGYWSTHDVVMESFIDTLSGTQPSLADNSDFAETVSWMAALGTMRDITLSNEGFSLDEVVSRGVPNQSSRDELLRETVQETPLLLQFDLAASGVGFDGERGFNGLVIAHEDEETAAQNVERLEERLRNARIDDTSDRKWSDRIERVETAQEGRFIVARVYFDETESLLSFQLNFGNTLLVHE